ncbi:MAG: carboxylating nicotinate-nucleotide diphosphorylase [Actinomycetota bacterium]
MAALSAPPTPAPTELAAFCRAALDEDAPAGDLTTDLVVPVSARCTAEIRAKAAGVLSGRAAAEEVFRAASERETTGAVEITWNAEEGACIAPGDVLAVVRGPARTVLLAERVALNLLSHLSGVATLTSVFVEAASPARVLCTRKTTPGMRALERQAVASGGGTLHRASLSDAVLAKDNHVRLAGGAAEAVRRAREGGLPVEVEVETLEQLEEALAAGADRILLDNPTPDLVREAVRRVGDAERLEVSGGVTLETVGAFVQAGARVLSVGRLTHSAPVLDLSLEIVDGNG